MEKLRELDRADKAQDYAHDETMAQMEHDTRRVLAEFQKDMSASQIAALGIKDLSPEAQVALAAALGSDKELEYLKKSSDERAAMLKDLIEYTRGIEKENREQQQDTLDKMMKAMLEAMRTNAGIVSGAVAGQRASVEGTLNVVKDIATHRQDEVDSDKREAKADARHAQERLDHTQDTALHYTTKFASTEATADALKGKDPAEVAPMVFVLTTMGNATVSLADVLQLINDGEIEPDTELSLNGQIVKAYDCEVLRGRLNNLYSVKCPNCGEIGLKGHLCPECHKQL